MDSNNFSKSQKLLHLSQRFRQLNSVRPLSNPQPHPSESFKRPNRSVVLICLFEEGDDVFVILTKQSSKLSSYSGHFSLPGAGENSPNGGNNCDDKGYKAVNCLEGDSCKILDQSANIEEDPDLDTSVCL
ncbi:hypothetical protein L1987_71418 [Smallanthus sonchifolius]|uniref:Uncharacterized protein n=1 Tax=Smallanthus sonchifolius TaxID=185202 RepID=A0ACB9ASC9_9ASTR|nr:hypothetical protein L1987_71418 [Smallanthus sonchifolius]